MVTKREKKKLAPLLFLLFLFIIIFIIDVISISHQDDLYMFPQIYGFFQFHWRKRIQF